MIKTYSNSIQALRQDEIDLIFAVMDKRTLSEPMRLALMYRYQHGCSVRFAAMRCDVDRGALSSAEDKVLRIFWLIQNHYEEKAK